MTDQQITQLAERLAATERAEGHEESAATWEGVARKAGLEVFACTRLGCRLSVSSCVSRRSSAKTTIRPGSNRRLLDDGAVCSSCEVGAAHARGESPERWADGSPVVRLRISSAASAPVAAPVTIRETPGLLVPAHQVERVAKARAEKAKRVLAKQRPAQARRSTAKSIAHGGETLTRAEWAARAGISKRLLIERLLRGEALPHALRPAEPRGQGCSVSVSVRLTEAAWTAIDALAGPRTLTVLVRDALELHLGASPVRPEGTRTLGILVKPETRRELDRLWESMPQQGRPSRDSWVCGAVVAWLSAHTDGVVTPCSATSSSEAAE